GWFPRPRGGWEPKAAAARLRQAAIAAGRDPATLSITVFNAPADRAALAPYREAGIARVLFEVPDARRDEVLRRLDQSAPPAADNRGSREKAWGRGCLAFCVAPRPAWRRPGAEGAAGGGGVV